MSDGGDWYPSDGVYEVYSLNEESGEVTLQAEFYIQDEVYNVTGPGSVKDVLLSDGGYLFYDRLSGRFHPNSCHRIRKNLYKDKESMEAIILTRAGNPKTLIGIIRVGIIF